MTVSFVLGDKGDQGTRGSVVSHQGKKNTITYFKTNGKKIKKKSNKKKPVNTKTVDFLVLEIAVKLWKFYGT